MKLRAYQDRAIQDLRRAYSSGKRAPVLVLPTGAGKTVVASEIIRLAIEKQNRVLFAVPRIELLNQSIAKLAMSGIASVRTVQAQNDNGQADARVTVASIPTLTTQRWMENPVAADLVVIDECHHGKARTYEQFLRLYEKSKLLGLTATPQRGDSRALGDLFDSIVVGSTVKELIDLEALVPCRVYAPPRIMDSREIAQDPVDAYEQRCAGMKAIVFCSTVAEAQRTAEAFQARGIRARWLSGESDDREETVAAFKRRDFDVLVNVNLFVEGFDDPSTEAAIMARRFTHVGSWLQAIGRILRPSPGKKTATVVDLCGSALVHGTPEIEREYSLDGKGIASTRKVIRQCQSCGGVFNGGDRTCPYCEYEMPALTRAQAKALGIQLEEVTSITDRTSWPMRAKRRGICSGCGLFMEMGAWIIYSRSTNTARHPRCAARKAA
jgi:DNA repair protein RadD